MADLATVERAFMKAHQAGDAKAAAVLAAEVKRLRATAAPPPEPPTVTGQPGLVQPKFEERLGGPDAGVPQGEVTPNIAAKGAMAPGSRMGSNLGGKFAQGALLNFADEIGAAVGVPAQMVKDYFAGQGLSPGETYEQNLAAERAQQAATAEAHPIASPALELAGAVSSAVIPATGALRGTQALTRAPALIRTIAGGKGLLPVAVRGAGAGAASGAVAGFGEGEGLEDRLSKAETGAKVGAATGAAIPIIGKGIGQGYRLGRAVVRGATAPLRSLANTEEFAAQKVAEAFDRDRLPVTRAGRIMDLQRKIKPDVVLGDVGGENTQNLLRATANVPGKQRSKLVRDLDRRQDQQLNRLRADVSSAFGDHASFTATTEANIAARKAAADPLFAIARNTGTPWTVQLQSVLSRPLTQKLVAQAREDAANRGEQFKAIFAQISPGGKVKFSRVPDTDALHRIKVTIDNSIRKLRKREETGLGNIDIRTLTILKKDLLNAIQNPPYKRALRQFAGDSASVNAIEEGFEEGLTMEPEAITSTLRGLGQAEADLWRLGLARKVVNELRDTGRQGTNRADILYSPKYLDRLRAAFRDSPTGRDFMRRLQIERKMFETRYAVKGGSTSAKQLAEGAEAGVEAENIRQAADIGGKVIRGDLIGALVSWVGRAKNLATGLRPEVADEIIKQLTSKDPATVQRAAAIVQRQMGKLAARKATPEAIRDVSTVAGFGAIPSAASVDQ